MKRLLHLPTVMACALLLSGCDQGAATAQVADANKKIQELQAKVNELEQKISWSDLVKDIDRIAFLTPGSDGYSVVKIDLGALTVALDDIKPYANGSKVTLRFGNTMSATINGLTATLEWGPVGKDGLPINENAKSREVKFNESLRAGAWTQVNVVLEGVPPADLGFVRVRQVGHTGIALSRR